MLTALASPSERANPSACNDSSSPGSTRTIEVTRAPPDPSNTVLQGLGGGGLDRGSYDSDLLQDLDHFRCSLRAGSEDLGLLALAGRDDEAELLELRLELRRRALLHRLAPR